MVSAVAPRKWCFARAASEYDYISTRRPSHFCSGRGTHHLALLPWARAKENKKGLEGVRRQSRKLIEIRGTSILQNQSI